MQRPARDLALVLSLPCPDGNLYELASRRQA